MKICILGNVESSWQKTYSWFCKTLWQGCLLNGHQVIPVKYKQSFDDIKNIILDDPPDVIFTHTVDHGVHDIRMVLSFFEHLRSYYGVKIVHTLHDARHEPRYSGNLSYAYDLALLGQTHNLKKFQTMWKVPVYFWPYPCLYQEKIADPRPDLAFSEAVFTGSPNTHGDRAQFIANLRRYTPLKIFITKSTEDKKELTAELATSAYCILALCTGYDIKHYTDCRFWQYGGAGAFIIGRKFNSMDELIPDSLYLPFDSYAHPDQVGNLINIYKNKKTETAQMRINMFNFMQRYHNAKIRVKYTIDIIEGKTDTVKAFISEQR